MIFILCHPKALCLYHYLKFSFCNFYRMDVKTKVELMNVMDSYWNMLPPELEDFILLLKRNQELFDQEKKERMREVCDEIVMYGRVKEKWGIGHVKCYIKKGPCFGCDCYHTRVVGCYLDVENVTREAFLAYNLKKALQRVNHVKSFL